MDQISPHILTLYLVCSTRFDLLEAVAPQDGTEPDVERMVKLGFNQNIFTKPRLDIIAKRRNYFEGVMLGFASEYTNPPCPSDEVITGMLKKAAEPDAAPAFAAFEAEVRAIEIRRTKHE